MKTKNQRAFTLIEILTVISIIGILSALVYSSFGGAKSQSRDQQKITDIKNIQLALEVYFNQNHQYPISLNNLVPTYIPSIPKSAKYDYFPITNVAPASPVCTSYHLYTTLEQTSSYLDSKKSFNSVGLNECGGGTDTGIDASIKPLVYDVVPQ